MGCDSELNASDFERERPVPRAKYVERVTNLRSELSKANKAIAARDAKIKGLEWLVQAKDHNKSFWYEEHNKVFALLQKYRRAHNRDCEVNPDGSLGEDNQGH